MSKKRIPPLFLIALMSLLAWSCADRDAAPPLSGAGSGADDSEWLEDELRTSNELAELVAIRDEIAARGIARGVTPDQIREAGADPARSNALFGFTPDEARATFDRIDGLTQSLFTRYPALADMAARDEWRYPACGVEDVALAWERYAKTLPAALDEGAIPGGSAALRAPARPPLTCKMTQLIVGFALCAVKSGGHVGFYTVCSYGVFCSSCDGGIADIICP
jgi:hypothetical protein